MGKNTGIEWTDSTWNPWTGCKKVSLGCKNCYMFRDKVIYGKGDPTEVVKADLSHFYSPKRWNKPSKIFVCSWSDFFIEKADEWREEAWGLIRDLKKHKFIILTKRPENIISRLPIDWGSGYKNVWLGVSAENQIWADIRIALLLKIPAIVRFASFEPLLGPIEISESNKIDWIIVGGESGPNHRPMKESWVINIRNGCKNYGIPFFFKQWGGVQRLENGRELEGKNYDEYPIR